MRVGRTNPETVPVCCSFTLRQVVMMIVQIQTQHRINGKITVHHVSNFHYDHPQNGLNQFWKDGFCWGLELSRCL